MPRFSPGDRVMAGVVWLLERVDTEGPTYLRAFSADDVWDTTEALEAKQFTSEAEAQNVLAYLDSRGLPSNIWEPREHDASRSKGEHCRRSGLQSGSRGCSR